MLYAGFATLEEAKKHRDNHGGWIFVPDNSVGPIWFSLKFTPTPIMLHQATNGLSGDII